MDDAQRADVEAIVARLTKLPVRASEFYTNRKQHRVLLPEGKPKTLFLCEIIECVLTTQAIKPESFCIEREGDVSHLTLSMEYA